MATERSQRSITSESQIERILAELTATATDHESLRSWAATTDVQLERVVAIETLTYLRLGARDEQGEPIVLMLLDGAWERIF